MKHWHFTRHIVDALKLNWSRRRLYADWTHGLSRPLLSEVIFNQALTLVPALLFDLLGLWYQLRGIPFLVDEFVDMKETPAQRQQSYDPAKNAKYEVDEKQLLNSLRQAFQRGSFDGLKTEGLAWISKLEVAPDHWAMTRHLIESLVRTSHFAPLRIRECRLRGINSPILLYKVFIHLHLWGLGKAVSVDRKAHPLQILGSGFLINDVPNLLEGLTLVQSASPSSVQELSRSSSTPVKHFDT